MVEEEELGIFHMAAEGCHGHSPGLQCINSAAMGAILSSDQEVDDKIATYFAAIFNSHHAATAASEPVNSRVSFVPNSAHFFTFHNGLPHLSQEERNSLEVP
jgi:hypothetical protein